MKTHYPRRFLLLFLSCILGLSWPGSAESMRHLSIYEKQDAYCAWPAMVRAANGDLLVAFTRSEEHLGPNGEILLSRSTNNGQTWLPPAIVHDSPLDDRESGLTLLSDGRLLMHLRTTRWTAEQYLTLPDNAYESATLGRWMLYVNQPAYREAAKFDGAWHAVSEDNGHTWSTPTPGKDSIHGGLQLEDGSILVASYRDDSGNIGIYRGDSAQGEFIRVAMVESPQPDRIRFGEPHILQLDSGRILMMIRATAIPYDDQSPLCHLWLSWSDDNGQTWAEAVRTPLWGFPPHLLQLEDGRVLCTYGYRRSPFGIHWSLEDEIIIRDDAPNKDLGYPVSIELSPGRILTVYYQPNVPAGTVQRMHPPDPLRRKPGILGTIWQLPPE